MKKINPVWRGLLLLVVGSVVGYALGVGIDAAVQGTVNFTAPVGGLFSLLIGVILFFGALIGYRGVTRGLVWQLIGTLAGLRLNQVNQGHGGAAQILLIAGERRLDSLEPAREGAPGLRGAVLLTLLWMSFRTAMSCRIAGIDFEVFFRFLPPGTDVTPTPAPSACCSVCKPAGTTASGSRPRAVCAGSTFSAWPPAARSRRA